MRPRTLDLLCCPECRSHPLELTEIAVLERPPVGSGQPDRDVETGFLQCLDCHRFYFIDGGIAAMVGERFAPLVDVDFPARHPAAFAPVEDALAAYVDRARAAQDAGRLERWGLDDVEFWEDRVYGDPASVEAMFERFSRARPDAGARTYPRERAIFTKLRPRIGDGVLLDLGCGLSQTVRTLCDPGRHGYDYVGIELSRSALEVNRRSLAGDFVLASIEQLPFREGSADAVIMLGTLHHLEAHDATLERIVGTVKPGGLLGIDEVVARHGVRERLRSGSAPAESAHNEFVDPQVLRGAVERGADIVHWQRLFSPVRGLSDRYLAEPMRSRPWLTRLVLGLDALAIATLGRVWSLFRGSEVLLLAERHGASS